MLEKQDYISSPPAEESVETIHLTAARRIFLAEKRSLFSLLE